MSDHATNGNDAVPAQPAALGDQGNSVAQLQSYLMRFGYLQAPPEALGNYAAMEAELAAVEAPAAEKSGDFDRATQEALRSYQAFNGLPVTGELDQATIAQMGQPRCGFPDLPTAGDGTSARFVAQGSRWTTNKIRYGFDTYTPQLTEDEVRVAVAQAFALWSAASPPLTFTEVPLEDDPEIVIRFAPGNHGDGNDFDGPGNVLAHAYYPPPAGGTFAGDAHFDEAETWTVTVPNLVGTFDLVTVAAHEFGHSLGLAHSTIRAALMFPSYGGPHQFLDADDIGGIQSIYGS